MARIEPLSEKDAPAEVREFDLTTLISKAPELLGIGLDEATAILVQKDTLEVIGQSYIAIYDYDNIVNKHTPFFFLSEGQKYDLADRKVIQAPRRRGQQTEEE